VAKVSCYYYYYHHSSTSSSSSTSVCVSSSSSSSSSSITLCDCNSNVYMVELITVLAICFTISFLGSVVF
jgi:hypothetical protein